MMKHKWKLFWLLFLIFEFWSVMEGYAQKRNISMKAENVSLSKLVREIENKTDYLFVYDANEVDLNRRVTVNAQDISILQLLKLIFDSTGICYAMEGKNIMLMLCLKDPVSADSGEQTIKGMVKDERGEPLVGAYVRLRGESAGVITDVNGNFSLTVPSGSTLMISFIGYHTVVLPLSSNPKLNITLREDIRNLDEVMVVGYGSQKNRLVSGSITHVKGEDIERTGNTNALGALQSQVSGVSIVKNNGKPGEGFGVVVRGLGTMGDSAPLVVIDGVAGGNLNQLNPADIESIDILKDAASAAIYGARAANGVILVMTKKGRKGRPSITLNASWGWQNLYNKIETLNAQEYAAMMNEARTNDGLPEWDYKSLVPNWDRIESGAWAGTDWFEEIVGHNEPIQNYMLNIVGGSEQSLYSTGIGYTSQDGIIGGKYINSRYERYTGRLNSEYILLKKNGLTLLKAGQNMTFSFENRTGLEIVGGGIYSNDIHNALTGVPFMPVYDKITGNFHKTLLWSAEEPNPVGVMCNERGSNVNKNYTLRANFYCQLEPVKDLVFHTSFGFTYSGFSRRAYYPAYDLGSRFVRLEDRVDQSSNMGLNWVFDNTLSYKFQWQEHHASAILGSSAERWGLGEGLFGSNSVSSFGDFDHGYLSNTQVIYPDKTLLGGYPLEKGALVSYFGRLNYDYRNTYLLTFILRADGSSKFARGHRWGYFPSLLAGWILFNRPELKWLNFLKGKMSWGRNGNSNIDSFQYRGNVSLHGADYYFGTDKLGVTPGTFPSLTANPDVTWETSEQINVGFDTRLLRGRLALNFDFYNKVTKDWLVRAPILASYGTGAPYINGGDVRNRGFEVALTWSDRIEEFSYNCNLNLSHNVNKVLRIANGDGIIYGPTEVLSINSQEMFRAQEGYPIGYFYGYKTDGIFQNQKEVDGYVGVKGPIIPGAQSGDLKFVDLNGNGEIDSDDRTMIGNPHPDYILGASFSLEWRGFDLSLSGNGTFGNQIAKSYRTDQTDQNYTKDIIEHRWHGEGTSNRLPRLSLSSHINWQYISDIYIYDGDYFRISNLTFGYDFKKIMPKLPMDELRLYATIQNLYTFTSYPGMDPEVGYGGGTTWSSGIDLGYYPSARTYMLGVRLKF